MILEHEYLHEIDVNKFETERTLVNENRKVLNADHQRQWPDHSLDNTKYMIINNAVLSVPLPDLSGFAPAPGHPFWYSHSALLMKSSYC
jgi:hypothetical protein